VLAVRKKMRKKEEKHENGIFSEDAFLQFGFSASVMRQSFFDP
jgi:hypothetical protein